MAHGLDGFTERTGTNACGILVSPAWMGKEGDKLCPVEADLSW